MSFNQPQTTDLKLILGSFLEVLIHEILYLRSLYPRDAFGTTRHNGISCHACRHPKVVEYIYNVLKVAVPSLISGAADEVALIFYEDTGDGCGGEVVLERYSIFCAVQLQEFISPTSIDNDSIRGKIPKLEQSLRNVLLKFLSLDGTNLGRKRGHKTFSGNTTFKLCLHTASDKIQVEEDGMNRSTTDMESGTSCPELSAALEEGKWFISEPDFCQIKSKEQASNPESSRSQNSMTRPLKSVHIPGFEMQILMEFLGDGQQETS